MITEREIALLDVLSTIANMPTCQDIGTLEGIKLQYDQARSIADQAIYRHNETPTQRDDALPGHVNEIGDIDALGGNPGLVIKCRREDLAAYGKNLIFADVLITPKEARP